jgi:hypothetical protein
MPMVSRHALMVLDAIYYDTLLQSCCPFAAV